MAAVISEPDWVWEPWALGPRKRTAKELAGEFGIDGQYGHFLLLEYIKWLEDKKPVDRYGYDQIPDPKALESWRRYRVGRLRNALEAIRDAYKMMENDRGSYQVAENRYVVDVVHDPETRGSDPA